MSILQGRRKFNSIKRDNSPAQALVEFALVLPLLLLVILGVMDFGRMFYTKMVLTNAAREGANYLAYYPEDANNGYAETFAAIHDEGNSSTVEIFSGDVTYSGCCTRGMPVEVTVTKTVDLIFDGVLQFFGILGGPVEMSGSVRMVVQ